METKEQDHGYQNAQGWASSIAEMVAALECDYDRLEVLRDRETENRETVAAYVEKMSDWQANATATEELEELADLTAAATLDGELQKDSESVSERIQESPLSVEVRSGWYSPGSDGEAVQPEEFRILLSTGGPALQIRGELDDNMEPRRAWLEYQDWGTPWTEYHGDGCEHDTLLTFCRQFYFGE